MLSFARQGLREYFTHGRIELPTLSALPADLQQPAGVFVTLRRQGELRGCVGTIEPQAPLGQETVRTAIASATEDWRFSPLSPGELEGLTLEISVLSPFKRVPGPEQIEEGRHGVLVAKGRRRGLYLPQVWKESGWGRKRFLEELCRSKAGLGEEALTDPTVEWYVFEVASFEEVPGK